MKPWRRSNSTPKSRTSHLPDRPEDAKLKIVPHGSPGPAVISEAAPSYRLIFSFLGLAGLILWLIAYYSPLNRWNWESVDGTFSTLDATYRNHGMEKFLEQKALLKRSVTDTLRRGEDSPQADQATNIAVYLFPDALPDENFEKNIAEESWGETISKIEKQPHTAESRVLFEALRADIWNYELVDKEDPKLSAPARQVIQIYDVISAP